MTFYVPDTQMDVPVSGSLAVESGQTLLGSVRALAPGPWMAVGTTGTTAWLDSWQGHSPVKASATGTVNMTAGGVGTTFYTISGAYLNWTAPEQRDYVVLVTVLYNYSTANWAHANWRIQDNGSETGIFPSQWRRTYDVAPNNDDYFLLTMLFVLPNWKKGDHQLRLQRNTGGVGSSNIEIMQAALAVL